MCSCACVCVCVRACERWLAAVVVRAYRPQSWPGAGAVAFRGYSMRYRAGLELVLRQIDAEVHAGEKVGICGRTGSGKSSMMLSVLTMVRGPSLPVIRHTRITWA